MGIAAGVGTRAADDAHDRTTFVLVPEQYIAGFKIRSLSTFADTYVLKPRSG